MANHQPRTQTAGKKKSSKSYIEQFSNIEILPIKYVMNGTKNHLEKEQMMVDTFCSTKCPSMSILSAFNIINLRKSLH